MAKVCRLCLQIISDSYYSVDENAAVKSRNKIMTLIPELELNLVVEPVLCELCYATLNAAFNFKCVCLANEQRITEYLNNGKEPPIHLCDLLEEADSKCEITVTLLEENFNTNLNMLDLVKKEPLEVLGEFINACEDSHANICGEKNEADESIDVPIKGGIKCSNCSSKFVVLKEYRNHLKQCARYECNVCNKKFMLRSRFLKHKALHNSNVENGAQKNYVGEVTVSSKLEEDKNSQEVQTEECVSPKREHDESTQAITKECASPKPEQTKCNAEIIKGGIKCSNCSAKFTVSKLYRKHLVECSPYKCDVCSKKFMLEKRFQRHKLTHKMDRSKSKSVDSQIHCASNEESNKMIPDTNKEAEILERTNETEIIFRIKCSKCHSKFGVDKDYRRHIRKCAPHQCDKCNRKFMLERSLRKHKLLHCASGTTSERRYLCEVCSNTFRERYRLQQHLLLHTGQRPFQCPACDKTFTTKSHLGAHRNIVHLNKQRERRHICETCGKKFPTLGVLQRHRDTHSQEKKFFCKICDKGFSVKLYLQMHIKRHMSEKKHTCDICKACFASKYELIEHYRSHTGEKPFKCAMCDKSFAQSSTLSTHVQCTHSNEKRFGCEVCGKRFNVKGNLQKHSATVHTEKTEKFPCPYCDRIFNLNRYLKKHIKRHTEEPEHTCSLCSKAFFTMQELRKHMRIHTGEKPYECEICHHRFTQSYNKHVHMKVHSKGS